MFSPVSWSGRPARWLKITAALEIVLAAVFFFIGWQNEILRGGFYLTAAILGGLGVLLWLWGGRMAKGYENAQRIKMQGVPGQAQIVGLRQTGMTMNEQPQIELTLNVQTQMHGTYQATLKEWVPLMMLGRLTSGLPLPVKVDPANAQNIVIEWESAMSPMAGVPGSAPGAMSMGGMQGAMAPSGDPQDGQGALGSEHGSDRRGGPNRLRHGPPGGCPGPALDAGPGAGGDPSGTGRAAGAGGLGPGQGGPQQPRDDGGGLGQRLTPKPPEPVVRAGAESSG
jgi:hypothetical protein